MCIKVCSPAVLAVVLLAVPAAAAFRQDSDFDQLSAALGPTAPTGDGVKVAHVEGHSGDRIDAETGLPLDGRFDYAPDPSDGEFQNPAKNLHVVVPPSTPGADISSHATLSSHSIYGNSVSIAPGITDVDVYYAGHWLGDAFLRFASTAPPRVAAPGTALSPSARLGVHPWIDDARNGLVNLELLSRLDWVVHQDNFIQIVGVGNGRQNPPLPLLADAFNAISVGRIEGEHVMGTTNVSSTLYQAGRTRPDIVVPGTGSTSHATTSLASAVALLIETARRGGTALSNGIVPTRDANPGGAPNVQTIQHAETAEVIRAVLMASADRQAVSDHDNNGHFDSYVANTSNGLNDRYGAGQLAIFSAHQIIAAGEQDSRQRGNLTAIGARGFDYEPSFADGDVATYEFTAFAPTLFTASLVWHLDVDINKVVWVNGDFNPQLTSAAELHNLDLFLYDQRDDALVASSTSATENTEHLHIPDLRPGDYRLEVLPKPGQSFNWDYGLAWQAVVVPEPSGLAVLVVTLLASGQLKKSRLSLHRSKRNPPPS